MMVRFLCLLALSVVSGAVRLAAQNARAEAITIEQGLSQGMIYDLLQTRDGFLWVATKDGLNRYDGYNFRVHNHDPFNLYSLTENTVTALFEDSRGWLWVGTESKGLELYDRKTNRFYHFSWPVKYNLYGTSFEILSVKEAPDGAIFVLQRNNGLIRIDIPGDWINGLPVGPDLSASTRINHYSVPTRDRAPLVYFSFAGDGSITAFSETTLYRINPVSGVAGIVRTEDAGQMQNFDIWVTRDIGLTRFRSGQGIIIPAPVAHVDWAAAETFPDGSAWVSVNNRLWMLAPGEIPNFSKPDWEVDESISTVETDRNGNIWVGTHGYGLRKLNPRKELFHKGAAGNSIWGLWCTEAGQYYCKIVNRLYTYDPVSRTLGASLALPDGPSRVLDMQVEASGDVWILGRGEAENGKAELRHLPGGKAPGKAYTFPLYPYVYARLLRSRTGHFWVTGLNCSLVRFDPETGDTGHFSYAALFGEQAGSVQAIALAEDGSGTLWVGTQSGLVRCQPGEKGFDFQLLRTDATNPRGLSNNSIACLLPDPADPAGVLWVGTKGGGIDRFDLRTGQFSHITTRDGLPDNVVYGILAGNKGELWGSTNRGIFRLSPDSGAAETFSGDITTFTAAQGLQDNEFNTQAFFRASNGELLFGGVNGLNRFFPNEVILDTLAPPVFLVDIRINHQAATFGEPKRQLDAPFEYLRSLTLNYDQNNLSFEFAALDFTHPPLNRYRYQLLGIDRNWVELGTSRFAHFTHLAPGSYSLRVQGSNGEGPWQDVAHPLEIVIHPPWWRSAAAYALYVLLLLYAGWQVYHFQMRRLQMREQLASEQRETERIRAMEEVKTNFFSNVTHEFRTPLTLILEPVRRILTGTREPETRENALLVAANSQRLLGLVNQLLDMAKLESGNLRLDLRYDDFAETLRSVYRSFLPLAEQRGIHLALNIDPGTGTFLFDRDKVEQILNNLVSNALKFTPGGGAVTVRCSREQAGSSPPGIRVEVADTGIGIPKEALGRIFDRFYQIEGEAARAGTGIGLALSRELAMRMNGSISVQSEPGKGSVFGFFLPMPENNVERTALPAAGEDIETISPVPTLAAANRQSLLLVEDNAELRHFIRKTLSENWEVAEASDGREGLAKAREILPDIIVSDVMMPEMDGYALCAELKNDELTAHIPVVLLTAKSAMDSKIRGLRTGADDYLTKPFNSGELLARLDNLAENRRLLRQKYSRLSAEIIAGGEVQESAAMPAPDREFMRRFILLLEQNLSDDTIGVEELAQKMFISRVQLYRKIKALTDRNVTDFVRDYRLDRAMAMLKNREGRVQEIAARVGFGSEKYFSRAFREKFGVPPSRIG